MDINIGKGLTMAVDLSKFGLDEASLTAQAAHVVYIGLRNVLMDSHAGITKETDGDKMSENSLAVAQRKLAALESGEVRVAGSREGDPVRAEAIRICIGHVKTALRKAGRKVSQVDAKVLREKAIELLAKNPSIMETARKRVEETKGMDIEVDI